MHLPEYHTLYFQLPNPTEPKSSGEECIWSTHCVISETLLLTRQLSPSPMTYLFFLDAGCWPPPSTAALGLWGKGYLGCLGIEVLGDLDFYCQLDVGAEVPPLEDFLALGARYAISLHGLLIPVASDTSSAIAVVTVEDHGVLKVTPAGWADSRSLQLSHQPFAFHAARLCHPLAVLCSGASSTPRLYIGREETRGRLGEEPPFGNR